MFVFGFSAVAQPLELAAVFLHGLAVGVSVSAVYTEFMAKGVLMSFLLIVPNALITTLAFILAAREAIKASNMQLSFALAKNSETTGNIRLYLIKFVVLMTMITAASLFSAIIGRLLSDIFFM